MLCVGDLNRFKNSRNIIRQDRNGIFKGSKVQIYSMSFAQQKNVHNRKEI